MAYFRSLAIAVLSGIVLVSCSSLESYDIFVKDPHKDELSNTETSPENDALAVNEESKKPDYVSITDPSRHPASTIICTSKKERARGNRTVVRKECTDMDGVFENLDELSSDYAEW